MPSPSGASPETFSLLENELLIVIVGGAWHASDVSVESREAGAPPRHTAHHCPPSEQPNHPAPRLMVACRRRPPGLAMSFFLCDFNFDLTCGRLPLCVRGSANDELVLYSEWLWHLCSASSYQWDAKNRMSTAAKATDSIQQGYNPAISTHKNYST